MNRYRYTLRYQPPRPAPTGLIRLPVGAVENSAETLSRTGEWRFTDVLVRERFQGEDVGRLEAVTVEQAKALAQSWLQDGVIARDPGDWDT